MHACIGYVITVVRRQVLLRTRERVASKSIDRSIDLKATSSCLIVWHRKLGHTHNR
jgi:hypothetical protein